jgi:hypothetical protein
MDLQEVEKERIKYLHSRVKKLHAEAGLDRGKLHAYEFSSPSPKSIMGEIVSASVDIAGCASRIINGHLVCDISELLGALDRAYIFKLEHIREWYSDNPEDYEKLKLYVDMNDYLRLLIVEYFCKYVKTDLQSESLME